MDFIFEEDMDEVGSDIEAWCPKCKADTAHTVITKYEDEVRRVQCSTCGDVHAYRKPRGEVEEDIPEPVAAKKRAAAKKPTWQEAYDKIGHNKANNLARPYTIRDHYHEGDIVSHPKFGVGFVTEISEGKAEVTFQDERRVLVHNRPDLAAAMPAIAPTPAPREEKGKGKKGKDKRGAAVAELPAAKGKAVAGKPQVAPAKPQVAPAPPPPPVAKGKVVEPPKKPAAPVQGKVERAKAAATKKAAVVTKGKAAPAKPAVAAATSAKPVAASVAKKPAPPAPARPVRPATRAARPEPAKSKLKKKAGKAR